MPAREEQPLSVSARDTEAHGTTATANEETRSTPMRASLLAFEKLRAQLLENMMSTVRDTRVCRGQESEFVDTPSAKNSAQEATVELRDAEQLQQLQESALSGPDRGLVYSQDNQKHKDQDASIGFRSNLASTIGGPPKTPNKSESQVTDTAEQLSSTALRLAVGPLSSPSRSDTLECRPDTLMGPPLDSPSLKLSVDVAFDPVGLSSSEEQECGVNTFQNVNTNSSVAVNAPVRTRSVNADSQVQSEAIGIDDPVSDKKLVQSVSTAPRGWVGSATAALYGFFERLPEVVTPSYLLRPRKLRPEVKELLGQCHGAVT